MIRTARWPGSPYPYLRLICGDHDGTLQGVQVLIDMGADPGSWTLFKGHVYARQGQYREAVELYTEVTERWPERAEAYRLSCTTHAGVGEYAEAAKDYATVERLAGKTTGNIWNFYQRATVLWILGRREEAIADYRLVRTVRGRPFFSDARLFFILHEVSRPDEAQSVLHTALQDVEDPWLRQIFTCLAGDITPEELVSAAEQDNLEQMCEAFYYAGEVLLLKGSEDRARELFRQCVDTGVLFDLDAFPLAPMNEHELAQWRINSLSGDGFQPIP